MPRVDTHTVTRHGVLNLVDDCPPSSLYSQDLGDLDDVVGCRELADDTWSIG